MINRQADHLELPSSRVNLRGQDECPLQGTTGPKDQKDCKQSRQQSDALRMARFKYI